MGYVRFTHILIPLPSLQDHIDQEHELSTTRQQRLTHIDELWQYRLSHDHTQRFWHLFQGPIPSDTTMPAEILHLWSEWERRHLFESIFCATHPLLPNHYVLLAQAESERWVLAYWGPTSLDTLTRSRLLQWLSDPLPGILLTVGWGMAGVIALIAFLYVLNGSQESLDPPMSASLLLDVGIICGLLAIMTEPALQWLTTRLFTSPLLNKSPEQDTLHHVDNL